MARSLGQILEHVEHFQHRVLQDALAEASSAYWERRAQGFDEVGTTRCDEIAQACRNRAALVRLIGLDQDMQDLIAREMGAA